MWIARPSRSIRATDGQSRTGGAFHARTKPPFRADHVGSILRSAAIKDAREKHEKGEITAAQLKAVEDQEIDKIVRKQEEVGLKLATDGEYRRSWWHLDFYWGLTGVEKITLPHGIQFVGVETRPEGYKITGGSTSRPTIRCWSTSST